MHRTGRRTSALATLMLLAPIGCQDATAVMVDVSTDIPCTRGATLSTAITAGTPADYRTKTPAAKTTRCDADGKIGTLVLVPSGTTDEELAVEVATTTLAKDPIACRTDPAGCIIARRALRFVPHQTTTLPIVLHATCLGAPSACEDVSFDAGVPDSGVPDGATMSKPDSGKGHGGGGNNGQ